MLFVRILETMGVPPFVGFHHWFSLNSLAAMIAATFHLLCLNFLVFVYAVGASPILVVAINMVVDLPQYSGFETIITTTLFYGSK